MCFRWAIRARFTRREENKPLFDNNGVLGATMYCMIFTDKSGDIRVGTMIEEFCGMLELNKVGVTR